MIQQQTSSASKLPDRAAHYLGLLEEHEHRGGSLRSFAEARGLSVWTLYGWRRRLGLTRPRATTSSDGSGTPRAARRVARTQALAADYGQLAGDSATRFPGHHRDRTGARPTLLC